MSAEDIRGKSAIVGMATAGMGAAHLRAASSVISIEVPGVTAQPAIVGPETFLSSAVARRRPTSCLNRGWMGPTVRTEPGARLEAAAQRQICAAAAGQSRCRQDDACQQQGVTH